MAVYSSDAARVVQKNVHKVGRKHDSQNVNEQVLPQRLSDYTALRQLDQMEQ
jgi:hypothetical protein